jgi:hypothetical protein
MITLFKDTKTEDLPEYLRKYAELHHINQYNMAPDNLRAITEEQFAKSDFFVYVVVAREHRQIREPKSTSDIMLYYMPDGTGYGISNDSYAGKVKYYAFGCEHDYHGLIQAECRERNIAHFGMCYHVSECAKCGHVKSVDSSD